MKTILQTLFFFLLVTQLCFAQWYQQNSGTSADLNSVHFENVNNGWAVGDSGTIINTSNGGATWQKQVSGTTFSLNDMFFIDSKNGWTVGYDEIHWEKGIVLHTSNGGIDWAIQWTPEIILRPKSVFFVDSLKGWIVGDSLSGQGARSTIWHTNDGGMTWLRQFDGELETQMNCVFFIDSINGWVGGSSLSSNVQAPLMKTTNGGVDWNYETNISQFYSASSIHFTGINNGWISGHQHAYQTTNGGMSWIKNDSLPDFRVIYSSVFFTDQNNGWIIGFSFLTGYCNARIYHTTNAGNDWKIESFFGYDTGLFDVYFIDSLTGWVTGNNGLMLHTTNGGATFIEDEPNEVPTEFLLSQNFPNPFNPNTTIRYQIPVRSLVTLKLYDILGREIITIVNDEKDAGNYDIDFNASALASGVYFYRLQAGDFVQARKMILLK